MRRFHHNQFTDGAALVRAKGDQRISVCIPTLNEAGSIGRIVRTVREELMQNVSLVDEIVVVDSDSVDQTQSIARDEGARVFASREIAPETGSHTGKGENLWKALHVASGDLICYLDGDISNFSSAFVTGLVGPLLTYPDLAYVKAYYERPLSKGDSLNSTGGGRVSEILVRPLISMFYPELFPILQPLSGEYAARRELLETLAFPTGYGVEIAHLIDLSSRGLLERVAQTDLVRRIHRNRDDGELGDTAFAILRVMLRRMERDGKLKLSADTTDLHRRWIIDEFSLQPVTRRIPELERPPLREASGFYVAPACQAGSPG